MYEGGNKHLEAWKALEEHLFEKSRQVLLRFTRANETTMRSSCFAFYTALDDGFITFNFDTLQSAWEAAQEHERAQRARMYALLQWEEPSHAANWLRTKMAVIEYNPDPTSFTFAAYDQMSFDLEDLCDLATVEGDDLEGEMALLFWKVIEQLVKSGAFNQLSMTSPFRVGFAFHEQFLIVCRLLNWPQSHPEG
jgi:hypothetical protein